MRHRRLREPPVEHPAIDRSPRTWRRRLLGGDYFDSVVSVGFDSKSSEIPIDALLTLPRLRHLLIRNRPLSRKVVEALKRLDHLVELDLMGTDITQEDNLDLVQALPNCVFRVDLDITP